MGRNANSVSVNAEKRKQCGKMELVRPTPTLWPPGRNSWLWPSPLVGAAAAATAAATMHPRDTMATFEIILLFMVVGLAL